MNKTILAIILIALGGVLLYFGNRREHSVAGQAQAVGHDVANTFDGKARVNDHTLYYVGGGALILVGLIVAIRRST